jgi:hypothetical protein
VIHQESTPKELEGLTEVSHARLLMRNAHLVKEILQRQREPCEIPTRLIVTQASILRYLLENIMILDNRRHATIARRLTSLMHPIGGVPDSDAQIRVCYPILDPPSRREPSPRWFHSASLRSSRSDPSPSRSYAWSRDGHPWREPSACFEGTFQSVCEPKIFFCPSVYGEMSQSATETTDHLAPDP